MKSVLSFVFLSFSFVLPVCLAVEDGFFKSKTIDSRKEQHQEGIDAIGSRRNEEKAGITLNEVFRDLNNQYGINSTIIPFALKPSGNKKCTSSCARVRSLAGATMDSLPYSGLSRKVQRAQFGSPRTCIAAIPLLFISDLTATIVLPLIGLIISPFIVLSLCPAVVFLGVPLACLLVPFTIIIVPVLLILMVVAIQVFFVFIFFGCFALLKSIPRNIAKMLGKLSGGRKKSQFRTNSKNTTTDFSAFISSFENDRLEPTAKFTLKELTARKKAGQKQSQLSEKSNFYDIANSYLKSIFHSVTLRQITNMVPLEASSVLLLNATVSQQDHQRVWEGLLQNLPYKDKINLDSKFELHFSPDDLDEMTEFVSYYLATSAETRPKSTEVEESGCSMEEVVGCIVGKALDNFVIVNND